MIATRNRIASNFLGMDRESGNSRIQKNTKYSLTAAKAPVLISQKRIDGTTILHELALPKKLPGRKDSQLAYSPQSRNC
jgi:hypothetical protein